MENPQGELEALRSKWWEFFITLPAPYVPLNLKDVSINWNPRMRSRAGLCRPWQQMVELNPHLLTATATTEDVLLHELCHLTIARKWPFAQSHGTKWAKLMQLCGREPKRCHNLQPAKRRLHRRWEMSCSCRVHKITTVTYNRIQRGIKYKCTTCQSILRF